MLRSSLSTVGAVFVALSTAAIGGCAQIAAKQAIQDAVACLREIKSSPEGQIVYARLWVGDDSDTADKLTDTKLLSPDERNALVQVHTKLRPCRAIIVAHDNKFAAWESPYWYELFERGDAVFYKLASGEISVALANKLTIESTGKFQTDISKAHAEAVRVDEAQRQRMAEAMLQSGAQILASLPRSQMTRRIVPGLETI